MAYLRNNTVLIIVTKLVLRLDCDLKPGLLQFFSPKIPQITFFLWIQTINPLFRQDVKTEG